MATAQSDRDPDNKESFPARYPFPPEAIHPEDEISLIDLWLVLTRRKVLIAAVCASAAVLGVAVAWLRPDIYEYTTSIQLARTGSGLLESPETVRAKLESSYIPSVLNQRAGADDEEGEPRFGIKASVPGGSQIILLESEGASDTAAQQVRLHQAVLERLTMDYGPELESARRSLEAERARIEHDLEVLRDEAQTLAGQEGRLQRERELVEKQLTQVSASIEAAQERGREVMAGVEGDSARTTTLMLVRDEIQGYRQRRAELEERLDITLPARREELGTAVVENRRARARTRAQLQAIETQLARIQETRAIVPTMRSMNPAGPGRTTIMALAVVLGLMLGVFAAFFAEFLAKARERAGR